MTALLVLSGLLIGFIAVTLGGGGGGLYIGLLTAGFHVAPPIAVSTSLATIVPTVVIGSYSHWRAGNIRLDLGWFMLLGGALGAAIGGMVSSLIPARLYTQGLGALILLLLLLALIKRPEPKANRSWREIVLGGLAGLIGGVLSGIAGISGSLPIIVALLLLGCSAIEAVGTSVFVLVGVSVAGFLVHLREGNVNWRLVGWLGAGTMAGGFLAPLVLARIDKAKLERVFRPLVLGISIVMGTLMLVAPNGL